MKRILALLLLSSCFAAAGCDRHPAPAHRHEAVAVAPAPSIGSSIYPLEVALRDEHGRPIGADVFRGSPVVVSMFYGSCPTACPLLVTQIKRLEASLAPDVRARTRVLLVSFDADRDTPAALEELARAHKVDRARWRFAVGTDDQARVLGNALGINYRRGEGGTFSHDSVVTVLDGEGRIAARAEDGASLQPLGEALTRIAGSSVALAR